MRRVSLIILVCSCVNVLNAELVLKKTYQQYQRIGAASGLAVAVCSGGIARWRYGRDPEISWILGGLVAAGTGSLLPQFIGLGNLFEDAFALVYTDFVTILSEYREIKDGKFPVIINQRYGKEQYPYHSFEEYLDEILCSIEECIEGLHGLSAQFPVPHAARLRFLVESTSNVMSLGQIEFWVASIDSWRQAERVVVATYVHCLEMKKNIETISETFVKSSLEYAKEKIEKGEQDKDLAGVVL